MGHRQERTGTEDQVGEGYSSSLRLRHRGNANGTLSFMRDLLLTLGVYGGTSLSIETTIPEAPHKRNLHRFAGFVPHLRELHPGAWYRHHHRQVHYLNNSVVPDHRALLLRNL